MVEVAGYRRSHSDRPRIRECEQHGSASRTRNGVHSAFQRSRNAHQEDQDQGEGERRYVTRLEPDEKNALFDSSPKIKAFVVYDPRKAADDMDNLMAAIGRAELELEGTVRKDPAKEFSKLPAFVRSHLEWSVDEDGVMHLERLQNSFSFDSNRAGMFIMFASEGTSWETMMSSYDTRDWVEKAFDVYKVDADGSRSRTGDPDRARARFFIKMVALIMRIRIQNVLRDHEKEILSSKRRRGTTSAD